MAARSFSAVRSRAVRGPILSLTFALGACGAVALAGCEEEPDTMQSELSDISPEEEAAMNAEEEGYNNPTGD